MGTDDTINHYRGREAEWAALCAFDDVIEESRTVMVRTRPSGSYEVTSRAQNPKRWLGKTRNW